MKLWRASVDLKAAVSQTVGLGARRRRRIAKPSAYRPQGGKPTVCSLAALKAHNLEVAGAILRRAETNLVAFPSSNPYRVLGSVRGQDSNPQPPRCLKVSPGGVPEGIGTRDLLGHTPGALSRASRRGTRTYNLPINNGGPLVMNTSEWPRLSLRRPAKGRWDRPSGAIPCGRSRREIVRQLVAWLRQERLAAPYVLAEFEKVGELLPVA